MKRNHLSRFVAAALLALAAPLLAADAVDDEVARMTAERAFAAQWSQAAANALRARGDAESRALALLLAPLAETAQHATDANVQAGESCIEKAAIEEDSIEQAALTLEAEVGFVLDALESLPIELRAVTVIEQVPQQDAVQRVALGQRMAKATPTDFAGWLLQLDGLQRLKAEPARIDALLLSMAEKMRGTSDWYLGITRRLDAALATVAPPSPEVPITWADVLGQGGVAGDGGTPLTASMDSDAYRMMLAIGRPMALALMGHQPLVEACDQAIGAASARALACERIGRQLALHAGTLMDASLGLAVWHRQVEGGPTEQEVVAAKRTLHWQHEQIASVLGEFADSPEGLRRHVALIRAAKADELELFRDLLRERGIPLTPPPQWMPANPAVLQARR